jgi:purine-cytosine permease-like protein
VSIYIAIAMVEHVTFKRGKVGYDPLIYRKPEQLPPGYAAVASVAVGVAGAILGMVPFGFVGPIARQLGEPNLNGVEIGFQLAFAMAALSYLVLRMWEVKVFNR